MCTYQCCVVPGLFQTADYPRTLLRMGHPGQTTAWINDGVEARIKRQQLLDADPGPVVKAAIEEHVLRRPVGGAAILNAQLDRLLAIAEKPRVTLQVVPSDSENHYGMDGSFILFTIPTKGQVAYTETRVSSDPRDDLESVQDYLSLFRNLCTDALPEKESRTLITEIRKDLNAHN